MSKTLRTIAIAAVTAVSAACAVAAEQNNPLHPSFYARVTSKVSAPAVPYVFTGDGAGQTVDPKQWMEIWLDDEWAPALRQTQAYRDTRNPLHPSYGRKTEAGVWTEAAFSFSRNYVDRNNPLHPAYKR